MIGEKDLKINEESPKNFNETIYQLNELEKLIINNSPVTKSDMDKKKHELTIKYKDDYLDKFNAYISDLIKKYNLGGRQI
jgi:Leucine-rich repeat (LRR) protein